MCVCACVYVIWDSPLALAFLVASFIFEESLCAMQGTLPSSLSQSQSSRREEGMRGRQREIERKKRERKVVHNPDLIHTQPLMHPLVYIQSHLHIIVTLDSFTLSSFICFGTNVSSLTQPRSNSFADIQIQTQ